MNPIEYKAETLHRQFVEDGIECSVTVTKNARSRVVVSTNYLSNLPLETIAYDHRVVGSVNGKVIADQYTEIWDQIMMMVNKIEYVCTVDAKRIAQEKKDPHVTEMLLKRGYQKV